jgi:cytochrome c oxidase cbb3-type subunit III
MQLMRIAFVPFILALLILPPHVNSVLGQEPEAAKLDIAEGKQIFEDHCAVCHGIAGGGGRGPNLHRPRLRFASDDKGLRALIANGIAPAMPEAWYLSDEEVANVAGYVKSLGAIPPEKVPGDAKAGAAIYARSGCGMCHILAGEGNAFGPDLTEIGIQRGAAQLRDTLRHPDQNIPQQFMLIEVNPPSGDPVRGVRLNEDSFTIQLKDMTGRIYSFRKTDLRELKKLSSETPMPSYGSTLAPKELEDLVAFLAAQRGAE